MVASSPRYKHVKGRTAENRVVSVLTGCGFVHAERRRLRGAHDAGDITGIGPEIVVQVKSSDKWRLPEWTRKTVQETLVVNAQVSVLVCRVPKVPAEHWLCLALGLPPAEVADFDGVLLSKPKEVLDRYREMPFTYPCGGAFWRGTTLREMGYRLKAMGY